MPLHSFFDSQGRQLGDLFPMSTPTTAPAPAASSGNVWVDAFGQIAQSVASIANAKQQRKLEQSYLAAGQAPPGSLLAPGAYSAQNGMSNPWPMIALAGGLFLLMSRK